MTSSLDDRRKQDAVITFLVLEQEPHLQYLTSLLRHQQTKKAKLQQVWVQTMTVFHQTLYVMVVKSTNQFLEFGHVTFRIYLIQRCFRELTSYEH